MSSPLSTCFVILSLGLSLSLGACYDESAGLSDSDPKAARDGIEGTSEPKQTPKLSAPAPAKGTLVGSAESGPSTSALAAAIKVITGRLNQQARGKATRESAKDSSWREPELEKLKELLTSCCVNDADSCQRCITPIAREKLPADELWPLIGQFLGPLRPHAELGFLALGAPLLVHQRGEVRDRVYRMAVGSGVSRRGQPDKQNRRASTVPLVPRAGEPLWLIVEQLSPCPVMSADVKGPDRAGRLDVALTDHCSPEQWEAVANEFPPRATRGVWGIAINELPMGGLSLWMSGSDQPLLTVREGLESRSHSAGEAQDTSKPGP
jgi:hypothetical protein